MERYKVLEELGDGTCGSVYKAINMETSEIVAVKKMKRKFYSWDECMNLREVKSLCKLNHPNIIKLKEIVRENNELFFILDYMEYNLYQIMRGRQKPFLEEEIRAFMSQVLRGLAHMHRNGYFHRDLKPENLLVTNDVIKIADFGLAREVTSIPPFTDYVSTRWYRAPEVLLQYTTYTPAIDMWAVGAILAELFTSCPIFPGESEIDQLYKICCVLGTPDWITFPEARNISLLININYSEIMPANLSDIIPNASSEAIDLIKQLCSWDPLKRPTADQSLLHPFFHDGTRIPRSIWDPLQLKLNSMGHAPNLELKLWDFGTQSDDCFLGLTLAVNPSVSNLDISHKVPKGAREDLLFYSGFQDHPQQSVFWSLLSPDHNRITRPVESSLSLSFSPIPHSSIGVPQSTEFTFTSLQPHMLDRSFLAMSSSFQQSRCL
ncbi:serine/threonine-protein kinase MHK-like isoform X1 [Actinidia eriantha]|uniref:serine/threonine-protein kinase MHK-like isoform X1 n=1 Tax=Actinidia eriantha TaxID=165200 RepID=UPI0025857569|nr:serine/threonine-protein kinase MHK-like isoform X1 [Actinidia eriantha]XP_057482841.1 serine/threonine-protein kinase MHK-like isoform X1 [Actinidia eriantha]